jgi:TolB-like protein
VLIVAILVAASYLYLGRTKPAAPPITSLAVLPLANLSGDANARLGKAETLAWLEKA